LIELAHEVRGSSDGDVVVLLHGLTYSRTTYDPDVVPWLLDNGYRTVGVDLRGHGESPWADSYRATDFAGDVADLIADMGVGEVVVVGHSLGGVAAFQLAVEHPESVRGLFLEDPPLFLGDEAERSSSAIASRLATFAAELRRWQEVGLSQSDVVGQISGLPHRNTGETMLSFFGTEALEARAADILAMDPTVARSAGEGDLWLGFDPAARLSCPTVVLSAERSLEGAFYPEHSARFMEAQPYARVVPVANAAHEIHVPRRGLDVYLRELGAFLEAL
jgi:pimeloyl-ACP methyl ester carboxylesterase